MGPGKAHQRGRPEKFDGLVDDEMIPMFSGRGIAVLPVDHWITTQDRPHTNSWHPQKTDHNL
eukprot:5579900-Pyramimonas_sp.AAC.1